MRTSNGCFRLIAFFTITLLVCNPLPAAEREGVRLSLQTRDGRAVGGELIAVRENRLILLEEISRTDASFGLDELKSLTIEKRSRLLKGALIGLAAGGSGGALLGLAHGEDKAGWFRFSTGFYVATMGIFFGVIGAAVGGIWGAVSGTDKTILLEGRPPESYEAVLRDLRSMAKLKD